MEYEEPSEGPADWFADVRDNLNLATKAARRGKSKEVARYLNWAMAYLGGMLKLQGNVQEGKALEAWSTRWRDKAPTSEFTAIDNLVAFVRSVWQEANGMYRQITHNPGVLEDMKKVKGLVDVTAKVLHRMGYDEAGADLWRVIPRL